MVLSLTLSFLACVFLGAYIGYLYTIHFYIPPDEREVLEALERLHRVQS